MYACTCQKWNMLLDTKKSTTILLFIVDLVYYYDILGQGSTHHFGAQVLDSTVQRG